MLCNFSFLFICLSFHILSKEQRLLRSFGLRWCKITGNFTEEIAPLFSLFIQLLFFCQSKYICILKSTARLTAFHWLSSIEALFEHSGSFEGKTEKSKPPSFIPLGILQKLHCQNECILLSLLTYWLCVRSLGGLFVNQRTSHMTFMRKTSYDFLCVYSEFSLEILWFWQHCFCDTGR